MAIEFPSTKATKDEIRGVIGQDVMFYLEGTPVPCSGCLVINAYDGVNETSTNWECTTCSGNYWIFVDEEVSTKAHVRWKAQDQLDRDTAGATFVGDCNVTIALDTLTEGQVSKIKYIVADSRKVLPTETIHRGAPRDRIRFICREYGKT